MQSDKRVEGNEELEVNIGELVVRRDLRGMGSEKWVEGNEE